MEMDFTIMEIDAEQFVRDLFNTFSDKQFPYHNLEHTRRVAMHSREIGQVSFLREEDLFIIVAAAWFHDIGHLIGPMELHEENGAEVMRSYFTKIGLSPEIIGAIAGCIMATKYPSRPSTLHEKIVCDADTYHFGTLYFRETDPLVRKEVEQRLGKTLSLPVWRSKTIQLLKTHQFFTGYCQKKLNPGKQNNLDWLESPDYQ